MKGLLVKDINLNFRNSRTLLLYLVICVVMGFSMDGSFIIGYAGMLCGITALSTINYDEFDNGMPFLMSLPVSRRDYVREKFLYCLMMEGLGVILGVIVYAVCALLKGQPIDLVEGLPYIVGILLVLSVSLCAMIPIELKFGAEKSRLAMLVIYGAVAVILLAVKNIPGAYTLALLALEALGRLSDVVIGLGLLAIVIVINLILYRISVRIMENKEF